jgi:FixJ family two-component response regulator
LQARLKRFAGSTPRIFVAERAATADVIRAFDEGAFAFFQNPYDCRPFLDSLRRAVGIAERQKSRDQVLADLSQREREVLAELLEGKNVKQIAAHLKISASTVEKHRASIFQKANIDSVVGLILRFHGISPFGKPPHFSLQAPSRSSIAAPTVNGQERTP